MTMRPLFLSLCASSIAIAVGCGGSTAATSEPPAPQPGTDAVDAGRTDEPDVPLVPANKVDLLLVVDDSASMGDKSSLLAKSIGTLIRDLARVGDMHVGVLASSLGTLGGDVCPDSAGSNSFAHLKTSNAAPSGVLAWSGGDVEPLVASAQSLVESVGEHGCGFEAQLESTYRFLVQPDPWAKVTLDAFNQADLGKEIDATVLQQRKAFLRPDSALVVVMLTDEDDSIADPLSIGGQGWAFMSRNFPGSKVFRGGSSVQGTTAPRATSACTDPTRGPAHPDCTSCGFAQSCNPADAACQRIKDDPSCNDANGGYYGPNEDALNVRFHRMKERFGIDPQYPVSRYVTGFTSPKVPDRKSEHPTTTQSSGARMIGPYTDAPACTNPIFAASLPGAPDDELCALPRGPRSRELVLFAVLGGVPEALATESPDWNAILGRDPAKYDLTGIDLHMVQSTAPRAGLQAPSAVRGDNGSDPVHGREWETSGDDLQYACTFALPAPKTCAAQDASCDCALADRNPPLCGATLGEQLRAKAYPSIRPFRVAQALGQRAVIGSICAGGGYDATMKALATRLAPRLAR